MITARTRDHLTLAFVAVQLWSLAAILGVSHPAGEVISDLRYQACHLTSETGGFINPCVVLDTTAISFG